MLELVVLIAIAYAGARGVESMIDQRPATKESEEAVRKVAVGGLKDRTAKKPPGPTEPGGTFSKAAPRSAALGGKAAVPIAVVTETGATLWKATLEGYRERWPEIREERRRKMADRAAKRQAAKDDAAAKKKAQQAAAQAGPPPAYPPKPVDPPKTDLRKADDQAAPDGQAAPDDQVQPKPPTGPVVAPRTPNQPTEPADTTDAADPSPEPQAIRRHLTAVPNPAQNGDPMSSPSAAIPEIRTLDGLMNALTITRAMCEMRAEEALAVAADDLALSNRLDQIEAELAELEVDPATRAEVDALRESIHTQSQAAAQYGGAAKDAADLAMAAAQAAHKSHGGIAEAVQSSPIELAAQAGYYER